MDERMPSMMHGLRKVKYVSDSACTPLRLNVLLCLSVIIFCLSVDSICVLCLQASDMHHNSARASKRATAARSSTACTTGPPLLPRRPSKIRSHARRRKATKVARSRMMPVPDAQGTWAVYTSTEVLHLSADMHMHMHMTCTCACACHMCMRMCMHMHMCMCMCMCIHMCMHMCMCMCMCMCACDMCDMCMCMCVCVGEGVRTPTPTASIAVSASGD